MNSAESVKKILSGLLLIFPVIHFSQVSSFSFTSSTEFLSHAAGASSCITQECHSQFTQGKKTFQHAPLSTGDCGACHSAEAYPKKFGLDSNQVANCSRCHKSVEKKIQTRMFVQ